MEGGKLGRFYINDKILVLYTNSWTINASQDKYRILCRLTQPTNYTLDST